MRPSVRTSFFSLTSQFLWLLFFGLIGLSFLTTPARATPPAGYYLVWGDEFSGTTLDPTKWDYWLLGSRRNAVNTSSAVAVSGGNLIITTYTSGGVHYTAMVANDTTFRARYGYWEASIKYGDTNGMWSAIWMQSPTMGSYLYDPTVSGSEIDIAEHRSTDGGSNGNIINNVQNNIHWNGYGGSAASAGSGNIGTGLGSGYHTHGFLWTPLVYTLYLDGSNVRSWSFANNAVPVSQSSEWLILSSEVDDTSTTWAGTIPATGYGALGTSTTQFAVDYVRYYAPTNTIFWTGGTSVFWTDAANWVSNAVPNTLKDLTFSYLSGSLSNVLGADFSVNSLVFLNMNNGATINGPNTLTIGAGGIDTVAANHSVSLNCPINIGAAQTWTVGPNNPGNTLTINGNISGTAALSKGGYGTVVLNGTNSFSGALNVDTFSQSANDGALRLTRNANITSVPSPISIRNQNGGSSTLQLDGTLGSVTVPQSISLNGRTTNVVAIANIAGSNTISGSLLLNTGGANYWLDSDSGTLNFAGLLPGSSPTSTRTLTFLGAGNILVSGVITNGSGGAVVSVLKTNAGTLTLASANPFTGTNRISGGVEKLAHPFALQNALVDMNFADGGTLSFGSLTTAVLGGLTGTRDLWLTNASGAALTLTNGNNNQNTFFDGALRGSGTFVKTGTGTLTLDATNAYTGATIIAAGTVRFGFNTNLTAALAPVGWYTFDSVSGTVVTNSGTGGATMNGTLTGNGAIISASGRYGSALSINGAGGTAATNIVKVSSSIMPTDATGSWTVGFWIKTTTAGAVILYQGDGTWSSSGQTAYFLNANSGSTAGTHAGAVRWAGGFLTGSAALNDGNWHFITLVDKAGTESIYVDGHVDAVTSTMTLPLSTAASQVWIGGAPDTDASAVKINGLIDEVYLFNRALSLAEIQSLTNNQPVVSFTNYVGKLPGGTPLTVAAGATLDLAGISQSVGSLADLAGAGGLITNNSSAPVALVISNNTGATTTFSGQIKDASAVNALSLVKVGNSVQVLAGANSYRGTTTVTSGSLLVNGSLGTNAFNVTSGSLGGSGVINGAVSIQSGGTLAPGNSTGVLSINNSLTLGGTTIIELNRAAQTNDVVRNLTTVNYGGTLTVTNLSGVLQPGDTFQIFYAANYNGSFTTLNLPSLNPGLAWNTNSLTNGALSVIAAAIPQFTSIAPQADGSFVFNGTGAASQGYELDAATNLMVPIYWLYVTNAMADTNGYFQFTDNQATNYPQRFYRVMSVP